MQVGVITVDGRQVGVVTQSEGDVVDEFTPDLNGYEPQGRASETPMGGAGSPAPGPTPGYHHHGHGHGHGGSSGGRRHGDSSGYTPRGEHYQGSGGHVVEQGSAEVDQAIQDASRAHHLDPNTMRSIASIESSMNPASNANRSTQYKGLYQMGREEWSRFGNGGNIYNAHDNAMAAARMFEANRNQFHERYHRDPTDTELYMMHQQGMGFYSRGAMTNIGGNPYPGMRGAQDHGSFEEGWGREVARRKAAFAARHPSAASEPSPETVAPPVPEPAAPAAEVPQMQGLRRNHPEIHEYFERERAAGNPNAASGGVDAHPTPAAPPAPSPPAPDIPQMQGLRRNHPEIHNQLQPPVKQGPPTEPNALKRFEDDKKKGDM